MMDIMGTLMMQEYKDKVAKRSGISEFPAELDFAGSSGSESSDTCEK